MLDGTGVIRRPTPHHAAPLMREAVAVALLCQAGIVGGLPGVVGPQTGAIGIGVPCTGARKSDSLQSRSTVPMRGASLQRAAGKVAGEGTRQ